MSAMVGVTPPLELGVPGHAGVVAPDAFLNGLACGCFDPFRGDFTARNYESLRSIGMGMPNALQVHVYTLGPDLV